MYSCTTPAMVKYTEAIDKIICKSIHHLYIYTSINFY